MKITVKAMLNLMAQRSPLALFIPSVDDGRVWCPYVADAINNAICSVRLHKAAIVILQEWRRPFVPYDTDAVVWNGRATGQQEEQGIAHGWSIYHA